MDNGKKLEIVEQRSYPVVKSNEIIQKARYELNIQELKVLAFIISKIKPTDAELQEYTFSIKDYCQVCGLQYDNGGNYLRIKDTLKKMRDKSFWITDEQGREVLVGWLQKVRINKGSGKITVKLDDDMQRYVIGLFENFTQYELINALPMKSAYSFRLYELLKSYAFTKAHTFDVDDLKRSLAAETLQNFKDFRRRVLETATEEINRFTDLEVSWEPITYGRKVVQVHFTIRQRDIVERYRAMGRAEDAIEGQIDLLGPNYYK